MRVLSLRQKHVSPAYGSCVVGTTVGIHFTQSPLTPILPPHDRILLAKRILTKVVKAAEVRIEISLTVPSEYVPIPGVDGNDRN